ncbi:YIP1 family protein [Shouchella shacheensis]|uniref:YIP1 family protein n=1 Tax=Shouchella shacheensis TaxID=1649580 RepID=UPI00073FB1EC|nr:YIP1 family protein [Shouchella shacheensis]
MEQQMAGKEVDLAKEANPFLFLLTPVTQLERIRLHPKILLPALLVSIVLLLGLLFPTFTGAGGVVEPVALDGTGPVLTVEERYYLEERPVEQWRMDHPLIVGALIFGATAFFTAMLPLIYFLIAKVKVVEVSYRQLYSMTMFASIIPALGFLYNMILNAIRDTYGYTYTSASVFVEIAHGLYPLLASLDVFVIYFIVVMVLGGIKVAGFGPRFAGGLGAVLFVCVFLFHQLGGMLS